jgi:glycosyltransferase involved in cell wall biosynthesis
MAESPGRSLHFVVPGPIATLTGGYGYDRRVVDGLRARGWTVTVHELPGGFPWPDAAARRAATAVFAALPDGALVVVDGLALGALPDEVAPHASRLRLIALVHHPLAAETGLDPPAAARLEESERRALRSARHVVVTSDATAAILEPYGVPRDRITTIVPGTDPALLARGSGGSDVHLLCVASLIPRKGYDVLIEALASIRQRHWRLTCIGSLDGDPRTVARLRAQIEGHGLADRVSLAGEREPPALGAEYDAADVFVLPTRYEGYGMVVGEALARGLPVVASDTGGIAAMVGEDAGILVPPGDVAALARALGAVIDDAALRARLAAGARRRRAALPTWDDAARRMEDTLAG